MSTLPTGTANANQAVSDKTPRNAPVPVRQRQEVQEVPRRRRLRPHRPDPGLALHSARQMSESTEPLRKLRERVLAAKEFL